jgi:hypothetical protein
MTALPPVERPDGRMYRPRKLTAVPVDEDDGDMCGGVIVFGTHDPAAAWPLADRLAAQQAGTGFRAYGPVPGWWRDGYSGGQRCYVSDEARGRAAVLFERVAETEGEGAGSGDVQD